MDKPLNHIRQNTKSARLIAVCKRSINLTLTSIVKWISSSNGTEFAVEIGYKTKTIYPTNI